MAPQNKVPQSNDPPDRRHKAQFLFTTEWQVSVLCKPVDYYIIMLNKPQRTSLS